jgi:hypothetical protein
MRLIVFIQQESSEKAESFKQIIYQKFNDMENKRIILILPDDSKAIIKAALKFYPRFFTYINDSYDDLCAVLTKMTCQERKHIYSHYKGGQNV